MSATEKIMTNEKWRIWLVEHRACDPAMKWLGKRTLAQTWAQLDNPRWMIWLLDKLNWDVKILVAIACDCAETTLPYAIDDIPRNTIVILRRWLNGEDTIDEVRIVAHAAADAAAYAAAYAAAHAAGAADVAAYAAAHAAAYAAHATAYAADAAAYAAAHAAYAAYAAAHAAAYAADAAAYAAAHAAGAAAYQQVCTLIRARVSAQEIEAILCR